MRKEQQQADLKVVDYMSRIDRAQVEQEGWQER
jgi:hypothetical protein